MKKSIKNKICSSAVGAMIAMAAIAPTPAHAGIDEYLGEVMLVAFTFCPRSSAEANGQLLQISQNTALFSLLGTTYGGDRRTTFGLPDLRSRVPVHVGQGPGLSNVNLGERGGRENVTLTTNNLPSHNHAMNATNTLGDKGGPDGKILAATNINPKIYSQGTANKVMRSDTIGNTGGSQSFDIRNPFLGMRYCIVTQGLFPSRS